MVTVGKMKPLDKKRRLCPVLLPKNRFLLIVVNIFFRFLVLSRTELFLLRRKFNTDRQRALILLPVRLIHPEKKVALGFDIFSPCFDSTVYIVPISLQELLFQYIDLSPIFSVIVITGKL